MTFKGYDCEYNLRQVKERSFIMIELTPHEHRRASSIEEDGLIHSIVDTICQIEKMNPVEHYVIIRKKGKSYLGHDYATGLSSDTKEMHWLKAAIKVLNI